MLFLFCYNNVVYFLFVIINFQVKGSGMKIAVLGDIHSNIEALAAVVEDAQRRGVSEFYSVGDVVGYGPDPQACIRLLRDLRVHVVAGNHDWAVIGKIDIHSFNPFARSSILWTMDRVDAADVNFLSSLPLTMETERFNIVHGTLHSPQHFYYMQSMFDAESTFQMMTRPLCFCGHSHVPINFHLSQGEIQYDLNSSVQFDAQSDSRHIINVGSVGQPRNGNPKSLYAIYDSDLNSVVFHIVEYDLELTIHKILASGLPEYNAERLRVGH